MVFHANSEVLRLPLRWTETVLRGQNKSEFGRCFVVSLGPVLVGVVVISQGFRRDLEDLEGLLDPVKA
jgi:hypothetical protein